ncbi:metallophosphoesterase family protein [Zavarzinia sp. CC-PAN008]|uniref:metallophosphoesterase family protein n=1 Tax=Zavarzinia sp. CC-PAN008 TaxID=3243332 RepID=UPI003F74692B
MLRLIHTSDWHIGQSLRGHGREREHRAVFADLCRLVVEQAADALIIAGDVFDSQNPSGEALRLLYETLRDLHAARPAMTMVVVAGNHDAAGRLEAPRDLLRAFNVHVVGNVRRQEGLVDSRRHLVPLRDAGGSVAAHVLALSYPTAACLPGLTRLEETGGGESQIVRAVRQLYAEMLDAVRDQVAGCPLIATGHLHVAGGLESEGAERRILVGGQHAVPPDVFPAEIAYVALGHLHRAQDLGGGRVRYSGSLFPLSATELGYAHGVTLVTLDGTRVATEHLPLARPVPFLRLPEQGELRLSELGAALQALVTRLALPPDLAVEQQPFVQVRLAREGLGSGFREEADRLAEALPLRLVEARAAPLAQPAPLVVADPLKPLSDHAAEDLFRLAFAARQQRDPDEAEMAVFHQVQALAAAEG